MTTYQMVFYRIGQMSAIVLAIGLCWWAELQMSRMGWPNFPQFEIGFTNPHEVNVYILPKGVEFGRYLTWVIFASGALMIVCLALSGKLNRMLTPPKPPLPPEC